MLACLKSFHRDIFVCRNRGGYTNSINVFIRKNFFKFVCRTDKREFLFYEIDPARFYIAYLNYFAVWQTGEVSYQVRAPIAAADNA